MLITFEGIDGAGKSTQIKKLQTVLNKAGVESVTLREPGGTEVAEKIRSILLESRHEISAVGELLLFSATRAELVQQVIIPALQTDAVVILDRFYDSTRAYQGYGRGIDLTILETIIAFSTFNLIPDVTFYLDIKPEDAMIRKNSKKSLPLAFENSDLDRMERSGLEFYSKVRNGYFEIIRSEQHRFKVLNALEHPDDLHRQILETLRKKKPALKALNRY
ncbi:dTMP kinase [Chlorobium phaeobacteroides]|uniref:Thymidylate kinase n=1 Tax=Chlorobium phaeobacteroides (strain DSM 266 / SMG 266 / 2430) TaxID=290317 RepID=KTHY_CHLPD|nr:dTMP kinase [Chlorobium phaeobacteroides]A1BGY2.1 RecName: Full=Thymidylate kinase; AltName: Full=dTMP kinase [Chlorobium phaeobacteroides DSM 266]ABL65659.1 thymidylate kinase [Chlorobium phaeobacteroides DSM 266]